jgi:hypothetical protein
MVVTTYGKLYYSGYICFVLGVFMPYNGPRVSWDRDAVLRRGVIVTGCSFLLFFPSRLCAASLLGGVTLPNTCSILFVRAIYLSEALIPLPSLSR